MGKTIHATRTQTNVPIGKIVNRDGGISGLTLEVRIFRGDDLTLWVDFADGVFKAAAHVTPTLTIPAIQVTEAPGVYAALAGVNISGFTIPAGTSSLLVHYTITAGGETGGDIDIIQFVTEQTAAAVWDELRSSHVAAGSFGQGVLVQGVNAAAIVAASFAAGAINAAAIAADAITAAKIATDAIGADELAADAVTEIAAGIWATLLPGAFGVGSAGLIVGTNLNATVSSRSSHSAADVWAVATRTLTAIGSSGISSQVTLDALRDAIIADDLLAVAGSTTLEVRTGAAQPDGFFDELVLMVLNTAGVVARRITGYLNANGAFTVAPALPFTPAASDRVIILGRLASAAIDVDAISDGVWDELRAGHTAAGSFGEGTLVQGVNPGAITAPSLATDTITAAKIAADAIGASELAAGAVDKIVDQAWEEALGDHSGTAGSTAEALAAAAAASSGATAAAVWNALTASFTNAGSFGRAANALAEEATVQAAPAPTATAFATDLDETDGFWANMLVLVIQASSGNAVARNIDGYANTDGLITVAALPFTPTAGDVVLVVRRLGAATINPDIVPSNR